jgi:hypothetical protein
MRKLMERFAKTLENAQSSAQGLDEGPSAILMGLNRADRAAILAALRASQARPHRQFALHQRDVAITRLTNALVMAREGLDSAKDVLDYYREMIWHSHLVRPPSHPPSRSRADIHDELVAALMQARRYVKRCVVDRNEGYASHLAQIDTVLAKTALDDAPPLSALVKANIDETVANEIAAEREACAKIAGNQFGKGPSSSYNNGAMLSGYNIATRDIAAAIRARSAKEGK